MVEVIYLCLLCALFHCLCEFFPFVPPSVVRNFQVWTFSSCSDVNVFLLWHMFVDALLFLSNIARFGVVSATVFIA